MPAPPLRAPVAPDAVPPPPLEPIPAPPVPPPLLAVDDVIVTVELVGRVVVVVVEVGVDVLLVVELVDVVGVVVVVVLVVLVVALDVVLEVVMVGVVVVVVAVAWQSRAASAAIVLAPWARLPCRVVLMVAGRRATLSENALAALAAAVQSPAATADEIASSCVLSEFD